MRKTSSSQSESKPFHVVFASWQNRDSAFIPLRTRSAVLLNNYAINNRVDFLKRLGGHKPDMQLMEEHQGLKLLAKLNSRRLKVAAHFNKCQSRCQAAQQLNGLELLSPSHQPTKRSIGRASTRGLTSLAFLAPPSLAASRFQACQRIGERQ